METLSKPGCIHVSQATADQLIARGRACWLELREDKVVAKGKGELTTFWVNVPRASSAMSISMTELTPVDTDNSRRSPILVKEVERNSPHLKAQVTERFENEVSIEV